LDYNPDDDFAWSTDVSTPRQRLSFTGSAGLQIVVTDVTNPLEYFDEFFTSVILDEIVAETNRRACQLRQKPD